MNRQRSYPSLPFLYGIAFIVLGIAYLWTAR